MNNVAVFYVKSMDVVLLLSLSVTLRKRSFASENGKKNSDDTAGQALQESILAAKESQPSQPLQQPPRVAAKLSPKTAAKLSPKTNAPKLSPNPAARPSPRAAVPTATAEDLRKRKRGAIDADTGKIVGQSTPWRKSIEKAGGSKHASKRTEKKSPLHGVIKNARMVVESFAWAIVILRNLFRPT